MHAARGVSGAAYACVLPGQPRQHFRGQVALDPVRKLHDLHVGTALQRDHAAVFDARRVARHGLQQRLDLRIEGGAVGGSQDAAGGQQ